MEKITARTNALLQHMKKLGADGAYRRETGLFLGDSPKLLERREEFLELMKKTAQEKGFSMVLLMLTDVLLEGTQLLFIGDADIISQAFGPEPRENMVFLPRVMSRKKQIVPSLSALWG